MIEEMDEKNKKIYRVLNYEDALKKNYVMNTYSYKNNSYSPNSLSFGKSNLITLKELFGFKNEEVFEEKFQEAISGDGSEGRRITTLISSSLCALLHFYNVSKDNPLEIENTLYDEVHFEIQNTVFKNSKPSNIDIALISHENDKIKKILFLESKFSEIFSLKKNIEVGKKYYHEYQSIIGHDKDFHYDIVNGKIIFGLNDGMCYMQGIKQMISHYLGICSFIKNKSDLNEVIQLDNDCEVMLGTIVFDGWEEKKELDNYSKAYCKIAKLLNDYEMNKESDQKITILDDILLYKEIFKDYPLDETVKKFYRY